MGLQDDNEITLKKAENPKVEKKKAKKDGEGEAKNEEKKGCGGESKKKDGDATKKNDCDGEKKDKSKENKCKFCGRDCAEEGGKKDGGDKAKRGSGDGEKKSEEKNSDEPMGKSDNVEGSSWNSDQDSQLREMKAPGAHKSWKDIAAELGVSEKVCREHWKELQKAGKEKPGSNGALHAESGDTGSGRGDADGSGWDNTWDNGEGADGGDMAFGDLFVDSPAQESEKQNDNNCNGGNKQRGKKQGKDSNGGGGNQNQGSDGGWSYESNQSSQLPEQHRGHLQSNDVWSKDDCEVLEMLEARYREHKWFHIQAGFFNWTGRMITAELIESKFRDDGIA